MKDFYQTPTDLSQYAFLMLPEILLKNKNLKPIDTVLFAMLQNRVRLSAKNNWLDEKGRIFIIFSDTELEEETGTSRQTWRRAKGRLVKEGLIELVEDKSARYRTNYRIYVKKLIDPRMKESKWQKATQESNEQKETVTEPQKQETKEATTQTPKTLPVSKEQVEAFQNRLEELKGEKLSQHELNHLKTVVAVHGSHPELIDHALNVIAKEEKNKQNVFYLKGILNNWKYRGQVTITQIIANEQMITAYKNKKNTKKKTNIPSWSQPNYKNTMTDQEKAEMELKKKEMLARLNNVQA